MPRLSKSLQVKIYEEKLDLDWDGYNVKDSPVVKKNPPGSNKERDIDEMLKELDRRMTKNGRLEEYRDRQHFTSPSKERREARREQEYLLENKPHELTY